MKSDRCVTPVQCLGQDISLARWYCVPPDASEVAGEGDQSADPWPGSLFRVHWGNGAVFMGHLPIDALSLSPGALGFGIPGLGIL